jgi:hypothetical protein
VGVKILTLRHRTAPAMNGCRWCGFIKPDHANRGHQFHPPTAAQRHARFHAQAGQNHPAMMKTGTFVYGTLASDARTRL